jgi:hypothetical protein
MVHPAQTNRRPIQSRAAAAPNSSFSMAALAYLAMAIAVILAGYLATFF